MFSPSSTILSFLLCLSLSFLSSICHFHPPSFIAPLTIFPAILCPLTPSLPHLPSISTPNLPFSSIHLKPSPPHTPAPQAVVDGSETSVVLQHLSSLTEYQLAVFAVYANEASEALRGSVTTRKFTLAHKPTRRNVRTKPDTNASVNT